MNMCENCGYYYKDVNAYGNTTNSAHCHFEDPDGWAPCEQDESDYEETETDE